MVSCNLNIFCVAIATYDNTQCFTIMTVTIHNSSCTWFVMLWNPFVFNLCSYKMQFRLLVSLICAAILAMCSVNKSYKHIIQLHICFMTQPITQTVNSCN